MAEMSVPLGLGSLPLGVGGIGQQVVEPPRAARLRWQVIIGPASGGYQKAITRATDRRLVMRRKGQHEFAFGLHGHNHEAESVNALATDVHVLWTSEAGVTEPIYRGRLSTDGGTVEETTHSLSYNSQCYRAFLRSRRQLYEGDVLAWAGVDRSEIAWELIAQTQAKPGGHLGISKAWTGTTHTGHTTDWEAAAGDKVGDVIDKVGEVIDGYDWDIRPTSASSMKLEVWSPRRGVDRQVHLELGGLVTKVSRRVDSSGYANAIRQTGKDGLIAYSAEVPDIASRPEGRWEAGFGDPDLEIQPCVDERGAWQLDQAQVIPVSYTLTLRRGAWYGPQHLWLGDPVRIIVNSGPWRVDTWQRVEEMSFTLPPSGPEVLEVTTGSPPPDFRVRAREVDRRLSRLERR